MLNLKTGETEIVKHSYSVKFPKYKIVITKIDNDSPIANLAINNIIIEAQKRKIKTI